MKATLFNIERRLIVRASRQDKILLYDIDNAYPQRVDNIIAASGMASAVTLIFAKFIKGKRFKDERLSKLKVNRKGATAEQLKAQIADDKSKFNGFAIHVSYNAFLEISELSFVRFKDCRLGKPDDAGIISKVLVYEDWGRELSSQVDKNKIKEYSVFNDDPEIIAKQIEAAGGIENYNGQIFYISNEGLQYSKAKLDPVLEDCESDSQTKLYKFRNISTGFLASHILFTDKIEDGDEKKGETTEFDETLQKFQGADNAAKLMRIEKEHPDQTFDLKKVDIQDVDDLFEYTEKSVIESIRRTMLVPRALISDLVPGSLGNTKAINEAIIEFNNTTEEERLQVSQIFERILQRWHDSAVQGFDYTIDEMKTVKSFDLPEKVLSDLEPNERRELYSFAPKTNTDQSTTFLIDRLGVGGTDAFIKVLADPTLTRAQKKETLIQVFGRTDTQAEALLGPDPAATTAKT